MYNTALVYKNFGDPQTMLHLAKEETGLLAAGDLRVEMLLAPVNASDLIPVTGAYSHRISLPAVAGYEGVGRVIDAPPAFAHLQGKRVLPLRGAGTWQRYVDSPAALAVPVPDDIDDALAARAYINPLAALLMLTHYPCRDKAVIVTAAGSECAKYLGRWAWQQGATSVTGIYRSAIHAQALAQAGITPISDKDIAAVKACAGRSGIVYDAVGGQLADTLLDAMPERARFVSYGLLSGQPFHLSRSRPETRWFHIRNVLGSLSVADWQQAFSALWPLLRQHPVSDARLFALQQWRQALAFYQTPGRCQKPLLVLGER